MESPQLVGAAPVQLPRPVRLAPLDLLRLGLVGIRTRRLRAALSALGISIGIATMIVVTGIPAASERALLAELSALGVNLLQATAQPDEDGVTRLPVEAPAMVARIGPVTATSAVANTNTVIRRSDLIDPRDGSGLTVLASDARLPVTLDARLRTGRYLDAATERLPTVVLGAVAATRLGVVDLGPVDSPTQVRIGDVWFTVIGILEPLPLAPEIDRSALVGWPAAESELGFGGHPTVIYLRAHEPAIEAVRAVLPATIDPQRPSKVQVTRPSDALAAKRATESSFASLFLALAGVALLVGGIGVANTMVISVLERRSEIGLRRALGASRGQIRAQFLTESVALSLLGGLAGTALGLAATAGYAVANGWPVVVPPGATLAGLGGALLVGVVAGGYPALQAARLPPTRALATT
ncbi:ABC transporter permease [Solwaraspora sp. WMMA2080]|uniref:ABC transporter permease n=1 Tax=unclassified Solwaraspora TaxID=2627926 RepID=UPI00248CD0AB|nr:MULTISPECIES: ABC transporter permease [unclassified Solwaraspora]WBB97390.1 ABC transporter permease [Solwaraspora sp. WMMA2059]WBC18707.1 ABC transporter permease [Solwaraspora sp. WMMA2080]